jgi:protein TonB
MTQPMFQKFNTFQLALVFSLAVHGLLLVIRIVDPEGFDKLFKDIPLEVILVNAKSTEAPLKAEAIAQASLAGGGEVEKGRATSPLPPSPTAEVGNADETAHKQIEQLQEYQQRILADLRSQLATMPAPDPRKDQGSPSERANEEKRRQLVDQLAEIEKRINEENARPKKRFISPSTREEAYALYYSRFKSKVEDRGTRNFPEFRGRKLFGDLTMIITVDSSGFILDTEVVNSSGNAMLDRQATAIVKASAPFGNFTSEMRRQADQLVITSKFRFSKDEGFQTTLSSN